MSKCKDCGAPMKQLFTSEYCSAECDKVEGKKGFWDTVPEIKSFSTGEALEALAEKLEEQLFRVEIQGVDKDDEVQGCLIFDGVTSKMVTRKGPGIMEFRCAVPKIPVGGGMYISSFVDMFFRADNYLPVQIQTVPVTDGTYVVLMHKDQCYE